MRWSHLSLQPITVTTTCFLSHQIIHHLTLDVEYENTEIYNRVFLNEARWMTVMTLRKGTFTRNVCFCNFFYLCHLVLDRSWKCKRYVWTRLFTRFVLIHFIPSIKSRKLQYDVVLDYKNVAQWKLWLNEEFVNTEEVIWILLHVAGRRHDILIARQQGTQSGRLRSPWLQVRFTTLILSLRDFFLLFQIYESINICRDLTGSERFLQWSVEKLCLGARSRQAKVGARTGGIGRQEKDQRRNDKHQIEFLF